MKDKHYTHEQREYILACMERPKYRRKSFYNTIKIARALYYKFGIRRSPGAVSYQIIRLKRSKDKPVQNKKMKSNKIIGLSVLYTATKLSMLEMRIDKAWDRLMELEDKLHKAERGDNNGFQGRLSNCLWRPLYRRFSRRGQAQRAV